jgi:putative transposase
MDKYESLEHFPKRMNREGFPCGHESDSRIVLEARQYEVGKPHSEDRRERVIGAAHDGATIPEIAARLGVSICSVVRFRRLRRETGSISPAKFGGYKGYVLAAHEEPVRHLVAEQPDITLTELKAVLATEKVTVAKSSISRFLHHLNLRYKKRPAGRTWRADRAPIPSRKSSRHCCDLTSGVPLSRSKRY